MAGEDNKKWEIIKLVEMIIFSDSLVDIVANKAGFSFFPKTFTNEEEDDDDDDDDDK